MVAVLCGFAARPRLRPHAGPAPRRRYERRRPEKTPLHKIISENLASWLEWRDQAERPVPGYVEEELRGYLECGILCFGFGRALCTGCGQGFVIAFSCKGRGVCPSCNGRHMAQTAAHLVDHVIPPVRVRQWVISVPKRLRCFLANRPEAVAALTKIFLAEIERLLSAAADVTIDAAAPTRLGAISFLHRFGSALNHHVHLHVCATDGVFMPAAGGAGCCVSPAFLPARSVTQADLATVTERVRRRVIRWFRLAHLLDASAAADMIAWENSGFSIDASVRIALNRPRRAELLSELGTPAAVLCAAPLCIGATVRDPRPSRPHHPSPLRAPAAQGGQLGRPGARAQVHAAGRQRRRRTLTV